MPELFKKMGTETVVERIKKTPLPTMIEFTKLIDTHINDTQNVTCPTLIIHGTDDTVVPKESTEYAYNTIASDSITLVNIKNVTHDCFRGERNKEIRNIITNYLLKTYTRKKEIINI